MTRYAVSGKFEELINGGSCVKSSTMIIKIIEANNLDDAKLKFECECKINLSDSYFPVRDTIIGIEIQELKKSTSSSTPILKGFKNEK